MLPSVRHQFYYTFCFFLFPLAAPKLPRWASGERPGLLTHGEVSCRPASVSKAHTGMTRLKHSGNQAALLTDISRGAAWFWAGETAGALAQPTLLSHNCCTLHVLSMRFAAPLLFSASSAEKEVINYLTKTIGVLQRSPFLSLSLSETRRRRTCRHWFTFSSKKGCIRRINMQVVSTGSGNWSQ